MRSIFKIISSFLGKQLKSILLLIQVLAVFMVVHSICDSQEWADTEARLLNKDVELISSFKDRLMELDKTSDRKGKEELLDATTRYLQRRFKSMASASQHSFKAQRALLSGVVGLNVVCMVGFLIGLQVKKSGDGNTIVS